MKQLKDNTNCHMVYFPHLCLQLLNYITLIVVKIFITIKSKVFMCLHIHSVRGTYQSHGDIAMNNPDTNTCPNEGFRY